MTTRDARRWTTAALTALGCAASACSAAFSFPEDAPERGAAACSDGVDNDFDGLEDCDDAHDCAGFCPEREANRCGDAVDNDGDGLTDAADPSCWPAAGSAPVAERCAVQGAMLDEPFDFSPDPFADGTGFAERWDSWTNPGLATDWPGLTWVARPPGRDQRPDTALMLRPSPSGGKIGTTGVRLARELSGSWSALELDFDISMLSDGEVSLLLVPSSAASEVLAPRPGAELMAITIRGSPTERTAEVAVGARRVRETVAAPELCDSGFCDDGMQRFSLRVRDGALVGRFAGTQLPSLDAAELGVSSPRLRVFVTARGDSLFEAYVDDLHAGFAPSSPCGFYSPQMPRGAPAECALPPGGELVVGAVALARGPDGEHCALVTRSGVAAPAVESYRSDDGDHFQRGLQGERGAPLGVGRLPAADPDGGVHLLLGASLAWDASASRWVAAATYRALGSPLGIVTTSANVEGGPVWLQRYHSEDCVDWTATAPRSELPEDAESPSVVIGDDGEPRVYFTRAPNDEVGRTLWLANDEAKPTAVAELDRALHVDAPVTVARVGRDHVLIHPLDGRADAPGLGLTVSDDGLQSFRSVGELPLLEPSSSVGFDDVALLSGSLVWDADGGRLLYGARGTSPGGTPISAAGTARLHPAGTASAPPDDAEPDAEPADAGTVAPPEPPEEDDASTWRLEVWPPEEEATVAPFVYADAAELAVATAFPGPALQDGARQVWFSRPVATGDADGDFELSFDLRLSPIEGCNAVIGVGRGSPLRDTSFDTEQIDAVVAESRGAYVLLQHDELDGAPLLRPATSLLHVFDRLFLTPDRPYHASLPIDTGSFQGVVLQRRAGRLRLTLRRDTACGPLERTFELPYQGALADLDTLAVGIPFECPLADPEQGPERFVVRDLRLRALGSVDGCSDSVCRAGEGEVCVDAQHSPEHCGGCGQACGADQRCVAGACQCPDAPGSCGGCGRDPCGDGSCAFGACSIDVGESCNDATEVPPEGGAATFRLGDRRQGADHAFCGDAIAAAAGEFGVSATLARDAVFRWTAPRSQRVHLTASSEEGAVPLAVTDDPSCARARCAPAAALFNEAHLDFDATEGTEYFILVGAVDAVGPILIGAPLDPTIPVTLVLTPEAP